MSFQLHQSVAHATLILGAIRNSMVLKGYVTPLRRCAFSAHAQDLFESQSGKSDAGRRDSGGY
ncbi:MAG: hypothetical protein Q27BB25_10735 [Blastomonas sp. CACIA14H2]|nr:MAG: hypothetical protein Q27BB25_10735 [Blastomonas sp. CACIA14H2]